MKRLSIILFAAALFSCTASKNTTNKNAVEFNEQASSLPRSDVRAGIAAYNQTVVNYKRDNKKFLRVDMKEPVVISVADQPYKWGFFQFPVMGRMTDGSIIVQWSLAEDNIKDYGKGHFGTAISKDEGKSWEILNPFNRPYGGIIAPNGERISNYNPKPIKIEDLKMPQPVDYITGWYKEKITLYRTSDMPEIVSGVWINRAGKNDQTWQLNRENLIDENSLRYSLNGLVPVVWWGQMQVSKDKKIYSVTYPGFRLGDDGRPLKKVGTDCFVSTDNGHNWHYQGRIPYIADTGIDKNGEKRLGFTEPSFEILDNGKFVSVLRTTDGSGHGPMYASHSSDKGKSWTNPKAITPSGVLPKLLQLDNGVLVLSTGRPGVQVLFSKDGGETWTETFEMLNVAPVDQWSASCGYTEIIPTGKNKFLLVYSDFKYKNEKGQERKAIKVREITVQSSSAF